MLPSITVRVLFFAKARELVGKTEASLVIPNEAQDETTLKEFMLKSFPEISSLRKCSIIAINEHYLEPGTSIELKEGDEIAVIPPISGG